MIIRIKGTAIVHYDGDIEIPEEDEDTVEDLFRDASEGSRAADSKLNAYLLECVIDQPTMIKHIINPAFEVSFPTEEGERDAVH